MLAKSLNKVHHRFTKKSKGKELKPARRKYQWQMLILFPAWVTLAYATSNAVVATIIGILSWLNMPIDGFLRPAVIQTVIATLVYAITIAIAIGVPYILRHTTSLATLGLNRLPSWTDIGLAPVGFIVYSVAVTTVVAGLMAWVPDFPLDQAQDVGFSAFGSRLDNILAFVTLVILAPFAEELLFRGYLYGKLKSRVPAVIAALVTSLLFGLAHFQLNVAIDVFILSLILCGLRSLTGSIWVCVLVHVLKNALAYYLLFVAPLIGG